MGIAINEKTGEIGDFLDVDQFPVGKTQFACVDFSGGIIKAMAPVGSKPSQTVTQIIAEAESWYAQDHGNNLISNTSGTTLDQEYNMIVNRMGMHYQAARLDINDLRAWVQYGGYPVLLTVAEASVIDLALGKNPYPWTPTGNHAIVLTGITSTGEFIVRDPANCTNLTDPASLRPGPRTYNAEKLELVSATVVVTPWLTRPASNVAPTQGETMLQITDPFAKTYFTATNATTWHCAKTNVDIAGDFLIFYRQGGGELRLPKTNAVNHPTLAGVQYQVFESGVIVRDPSGLLDKPGAPFAPCYLLKWDDPFAQTLLDVSAAAKVDTTAILSQVTTAQTALAEATSLLKTS